MTDRERKAWGYRFLAIVALSAAMGAHALAVENGIWNWACPMMEGTR